MIPRKNPIERRTPIQRSSKPIPRSTPKRASERAKYRRQIAVYLEAHPFDQIFIAMHGLHEATIIANMGCYRVGHRVFQVPRSDQIHHRNKGRGARLLDERWWMATSGWSHELVEAKKDWAREQGYLLPIQADADGRWGADIQALTTPALMIRKHEVADQ